jgi:hypothetical protein
LWSVVIDEVILCLDLPLLRIEWLRAMSSMDAEQIRRPEFDKIASLEIIQPGRWLAV